MCVRKNIYKYVVTSVIGVVLAFGLCSCGQEAEEQVESGSQQTPTTGIKLDVSADGWNKETSTPAIVCLSEPSQDTEEGSDAESAAETTYYSINCNEEQTIECDTGMYDLAFISPINVDGSIYTVPGSLTVEAMEMSDDICTFTYQFVPVAASDVTSEQMSALVTSVTAAVNATDMSEDEKTVIMSRCIQNAKASPNVEEKDVDVAESTGMQAAQSGETTRIAANPVSSDVVATQSATTSATPTTTSTTPVSAVATPAPHVHDYSVPIYTTVHHDAVWETQIICNGCGANITDRDIMTPHLKEHYKDGVDCSTRTESVLVTPAYDEQVISGYKCSCGAVK